MSDVSIHISLVANSLTADASPPPRSARIFLKFCIVKRSSWRGHVQVQYPFLDTCVSRKRPRAGAHIFSCRTLSPLSSNAPGTVRRQLWPIRAPSAMFAFRRERKDDEGLNCAFKTRENCYAFPRKFEAPEPRPSEHLCAHGGSYTTFFRC